MIAHSQEVFERNNDQSDRLTSLYGLTPKVESAIIDAVQSGAVHRVRTLVAPLHPADQADLLERLPTRSATAMVRLLDDHLDAETLTYVCLLYTSPSPRDMRRSRMPSSA